MGGLILKLGPNLSENAEDFGKMVVPEFRPLAVSLSKLCNKVIHWTVRINYLCVGKPSLLGADRGES